MKFIFVGNRVSVLKKMKELGCTLSKIYAVKNSYLEKYLIENKIEYILIESKNQLIKEIENCDFDCLISNGCPYILPISQLRRLNRKFINIHPSLLPDLKGKHPINGAILFNRKHGVTCHYMDDGIDTGKVIANLEIPLKNNISLALLYQISFKMEGEVFEKAFVNNFISKDIYICENPIYYTRNKEDFILSKKDSLKTILRKIKAFGIKSLFSRFYYEHKIYKVLNGVLIDSDIVNELFENYENNLILLNYEDKILIKYENKYIELTLIDNEGLKEETIFLN